MQERGLIKTGSSAGALFIALALTVSLTACSSGETQDEKLARAETLSEVVEIVASEAPKKAYTVADTKYLAVVFESTNITRDYHLLTTKRLMPVLFERYPDIDRFFLAWANDGSQFLKIQFDRQDVQDVDWQVLMIREGDLQKISSMYWSIPALR